MPGFRVTKCGTAHSEWCAGVATADLCHVQASLMATGRNGRTKGTGTETATGIVLGGLPAGRGEWCDVEYTYCEGTGEIVEVTILGCYCA